MKTPKNRTACCCCHVSQKSLFGVRLVLQAASLASWPVCLWSFFRAGRSSSGHGGLLLSYWPSPHFSSPSVSFLGSTTLHTSAVLCLGFSSPLLSCRTSGKWTLDPKLFAFGTNFVFDCWCCGPQLRPLRHVPEAPADLCLPAGILGSSLRPGCPLLRLPCEVRMVRVPDLHPHHRHVLREV